MPDYTRQINEIVDLLRRQPMVPQWVVAMIRVVVGGLIGFGSSIGVSAFNRRKDRKCLRDDLVAELDMIFSELRVHLGSLKKSDQNGASETNFGEFVKAELFSAVQGSPLFWNLDTSRQLIKAHRHLKYLAIRKPSKTHGDVIAIEIVLSGVAKSITTKATTEYLRGSTATEHLPRVGK
jgi:hypothetical protein